MSKLAHSLMREGLIAPVDPCMRVGRLYSCVECKISYIKENALSNHITTISHPSLICYLCNWRQTEFIRCDKCDIKCCVPCIGRSKKCLNCKNIEKKEAKDSKARDSKAKDSKAKDSKNDLDFDEQD